MMTESNARWAMYGMSAEQVDVLIDGARRAYIEAVEMLSEAVHGRGPLVADCHKRLVMRYDLLMQLTEIHDALTAPANDTPAEARASA